MKKKKEFALVSSEPLSDFDKSILSFLNNLGGKEPTAYAIVCVTGDKEYPTMSYYYNTSPADRIEMKGHLEWDMINDVVEANLDTYADQIDSLRNGGDFDEYPEDMDNP